MSALKQALIKSGAVNIAHTHSVTCPYCNEPAELVSGEVIYEHRPDLYKKKFWMCFECDAYVGCHEAGKGYGDGTRPLGRLANRELRALKSAVHELFDPIWRNNHMTRRKAYSWLARQMGIHFDKCHVGMFDEKQCYDAIAACSNWKVAQEDVPQ